MQNQALRVITVIPHNIHDIWNIDSLCELINELKAMQLLVTSILHIVSIGIGH